MVSRAVWGQSWTRELLEPIAGVFEVFGTLGSQVWQFLEKVHSAAGGIPFLWQRAN